MSTHHPTTRISLPARWLGQQMRTLRERQGLTLKYVGTALNIDTASVGSLERGTRRFTTTTMDLLLDLYRVYDPYERDRLQQWADDAWPHPNPGADGPVDEALVDLAWLPTQAVAIGCYSLTRLPHLLSPPTDTENPDLEASTVTGGRHILDRQPPPHIRVVLDEYLLHRPRRDPHARQAQLHHLLQLCHHPYLQIHILTAAAGYRPAFDTGFTVYTLPDPFPPVVHIEHAAGHLVLEDAPAHTHITVLDHTIEAALNPKASTALIERHTKRAHQ